jgi:hypothetical protein
MRSGQARSLGALLVLNVRSIGSTHIDDNLIHESA